MDSEVWEDIIFGLAALSMPLAIYIAALDFKDRKHERRKLMTARAMTRIGWVLSIGAAAVHISADVPHSNAWVGVVFSVGIILSCAGFLGIARNYRLENEAWAKAYDDRTTDEAR
jgi:hypothetical protein